MGGLAQGGRPESRAAIPYPECGYARFVDASGGKRPGRSDWPHTATIPGKPVTEVTPFQKVDDAGVLNTFKSWYTDPPTQKMILVDNAAKLYRF